MGILLIAVSFSGKAQVSQSDWMIGGSARFFATGIAGEMTANAEISVSGAYLFQLDNNKSEKNQGTVALGVTPSFSWEPLSDSYKAVLFSRYYYNFERVSPYLEANIGYNLVNNFSPSTGELFLYTESLVLGAKLGGAFYISPNVTFDTFLYYDNFNSTIHIQGSDELNKNRQYAIGLGLGFQIFLQCKK